MEKNFEVNNLVSFDDYLYESEKTHTEKIKSAIIERISSSLTYKGVIGQPKEQLIQSIKTGLAKNVRRLSLYGEYFRGSGWHCKNPGWVWGKPTEF